MHEASIARSLLDLVERHRPAGCQVRAVRVEVGPLQGIDGGALQWAWKAVTLGSPLDGARLDVESLPWRMLCRDCGRRWSSPTTGPCECGSDRWQLEGGAELTLVSLDVEEPKCETAKRVASTRPAAAGVMPR